MNIDVSDGSDLDLRIRGAMASIVAVNTTRHLRERDFRAFCVWVGYDASLQMFRDAVLLAEAREAREALTSPPARHQDG